ncbi:reverse transcriptase domain-containing protein [Tanacetum coccineum]
MAFIKGRQIIDGPRMVDEIISWAKKQKRRLMLIKVDFEKTFDSLSWKFLLSIIEQMGFSSKWRNWILSCLTSSFASVLINGSPTKEFKLERSLRQAEVAVGCGGVERQWWWLVASSVDISGGWRRWMMMAGQDSRGGDVGGGDKGEGGGCGVVKVTGRRWWRYSGCGGEAAGVRVSGVEARDKGDRVDRVTRNHIWFRPERSPENFSGGGGSLKDKILVPEPDSSPCCAKCGKPVDETFQKTLKIFPNQSDDNTTLFNAHARANRVQIQYPGGNIFARPPLINQNCCYECGDSLDGIFCQQCICKFCGKNAHYGYNCPPKVPIISNPEQCNQTINELPQILPNVHPTCNYEDENSFIYDSKPHSFNVSPSVFNQPPQPQFETYLCELCGNNAHYGYDCSPQFPFVYEQEPCYNQNFNDNYYPQNSPSFSQQYLCCAYCGGPHYDYQCQPINETYYEPNPSYDYSGFDHPQPPQDSVDCQEALDKILEELEEIKRDQRMLKELKKRIAEEQTAKENMSIEEMRHEQQLVDYKIKEITNDLGIKRFRGEEIDEEYERDCEIRIRKLKQDFNEWGSEVRKKEQAYEEEKYSAARRRMLSIPFVDEDDYVPLGDIIAQYSTSKAITPDLPIEEPDNSLNMGDEHLDTIPATESDEVIKSSVENLVPIPSEFEGIFDDTSDVLNCDNNRVNVEIDFVESLINHDTSIVHSSKIDPILEEFAGELAHIAPIPPRIVEADFDPNDDTSSDDDDFENVEYVNLEEVNDVEQEEKEFDLEDILQVQDVILREKLLKISRLISNIESLKDNPTPDCMLESPSSFPISVADSDSFLEESDTSLSHLDNSLPEFESFSDHTEETRNSSTTTHVNYSLPEYDSFLF